jgi:hypothetical protein
MGDLLYSPQRHKGTEELVTPKNAQMIEKLRNLEIEKFEGTRARNWPIANYTISQSFNFSASPR